MVEAVDESDADHADVLVVAVGAVAGNGGSGGGCAVVLVPSHRVSLPGGRVCSPAVRTAGTLVLYRDPRAGLE